MTRIEEIQARLAEIDTLIDAATGEELTALEEESRTLLDELNAVRREVATRQQLRNQIAAGSVGNPIQMAPAGDPATPSAEERAAQEFAQTRQMNIGADQTRAALVSSGTLATPTQVDGINDIPGAKFSSIIDMVKVVNCVGMGTHRVAYVDEDADEAFNQTEGQSATQGELGKFKYVDIKPESVSVIDYISKQAKKQTPLLYSTKVREQALIALRKKAAKVVTTALKNSELTDSITGTAGKIEATTLRNLVLAYGGDESVVGGAVLFLNKVDLIAFGDVRGTNEKKAIYEVTPDTSNPNTGIIREGGLSVRYCLNSGLAALSAAAAGDGATMFYGNPQCLELDLFSDYEINISNDFAFDKRMDTILGDVDLGSDVVVKKGFIALKV